MVNNWLIALAVFLVILMFLMMTGAISIQA